jgi:hypothetical protein
MSRRAGTRGRAAAAVVVLGAATALTGAMPWVRARGVSALTGDVDLVVRGAAAAPAVPAAALVLLAAAVAVGLAGRVGRWLVVVAVWLAGLALAGSATGVLVAPAEAARASVAAATGVDHLSGVPAVTAWVWAALLLGAVVVATAAWLAVVARRWPAPSTRHETTGPGGRGDGSGQDGAHADWDALSRGDDPT